MAFDAVSRFLQPVLSTSKRTELVSLASKTALIERDVAHLIFPDDVQTQPSDAPAAAPQGRTRGRVVKPADDDVAAALDMIVGAKRPLIIMGHGAWEAKDGIIALAEALGAPVMTTFAGKGLIPDSHPNAAGVLGRSGIPIASWFINELAETGRQKEESKKHALLGWPLRRSS